ncbi:MAG: UvrD-helicase domain-containing protein [Planctomycetes bacterium]|nr:UvrD-helicase domain-containing protein [Planctomycetota bacterium]
MSRFLTSLNPEQREAVEATEGPVLVLAGAGTGKTRVITTRIANLLSHGIAPENILAVTFTNKAAREMQQRVAKMVGDLAASALTVCTFHSFCVRLLRRHASRVGQSESFTICDSRDQIVTVRNALREMRVADATVKPALAQSQISLWKNQLISVDEAIAQAGEDDMEQLLAGTYKRYEAALRRSRVLDFDDLLLFALKLLREHDDVRLQMQQRFQYLMVDEYQDTNGPQYALLRALVGESRNICVVGDDDQSIYGWRGADVRKILGFEDDFPGAKVVRLETNYRSTPEILGAANALIRNNLTRHSKELRAFEDIGVPVNWLPLFDELHEANFIVTEMRMAVENKEANWSDFAILVRTQAQPRAFEAEMRRQNVPYTLQGSQSFFDRKEVRDVLAYLKIMANPSDEVSLLRVINVPPRGVGKTTIDRAVAIATEQGVSVNEVFDHDDLPDKATASVKAFISNLTSLKMKLDHGSSLPDIVRELLQRVAYRSEIDRAYDDAQTREARWNGVQEVVDFAANYARNQSRPTLSGFLEELLLSNEDRKEDDDGEKKQEVSLMTLHAAKGLEFPRVYLVGFEEGTLPHKRSALEDSVEEERRLAYVGFTRARRVLTVSWAEQRTRFGKVARCHTSRFYYETVAESPPDGWFATGTEPLTKPKKKAKAGRRRQRR